MYGNGVGIGMVVHIMVVVQVAIRRVQVVGLTASNVAAAGSTTMSTAVWLIAASLALAIVTARWAFAL